MQSLDTRLYNENCRKGQGNVVQKRLSTDVGFRGWPADVDYNCWSCRLEAFIDFKGSLVEFLVFFGADLKHLAGMVDEC